MESIGAHLRRERELRQMSLEELGQTTRIPLRTLQCIEADQFDELPGEVFARGFLRAYAVALGVDAEEVLERYRAENGAQVAEAEEPALASVAPPERGRRFGIAIALVILLILFTLALSIVLRPRHRDTPLQLSGAERTHDAAAFERADT